MPTALSTSEVEELPFVLEQNFPNPFSGSTTVKYHLNESFKVRLVIHNILGQVVQVLLNERQGAGEYQLTVDADAARLVPGVYTYRLEVIDNNLRFYQTRKFVVE